MALGTKYFMLNRENDWKDFGFLYNLSFSKDALLVPPNMHDPGFYISKRYDSQELETCWHRLKFKLDLLENVSFKIHVFATDEQKTLIPNFLKDYPDGVPIKEYLQDPNILPKNKLHFIDAIGGTEYENHTDIQLFKFKGRFLWFGLEILNYGEEPAYVNELKIEFPKKNFVEYLPELYQTNLGQDAFLERFVGVFQSLYLDLDDQIANIPSIFDPETITPQWLESLSEWMSFKRSFLWEERNLRDVLKEVMTFYKSKGTINVISRVVELYTKEKPVVIERIAIEETEFYQNDKEVLRKLYGLNGCYFCVFVTSDAVKTTNQYSNLVRIIDQFKPIDSICKLIVLNKDVYLDYHCYIGVNSQISGDESMVLKNGQVSCVQGILI